MALPRLYRKTVIKGFVETTYGQPPADWTGGDVFYIPAEGPTLTFPKRTITRTLAKPTFGADADYVTELHAQLSFTVELRGDGVDANNNVVEPVVGKLLKGCLYQETVTEVDPDGTPNSGDEYISERIYKPHSTFPSGGNSLSFKVWLAAGENDQAEAFVLTGCVGTYTIRAGAVGDRVTIEFTFTGKLAEGPITEAIPTIQMPTTDPLFFQGVTFTVGSTSTYCLGEIEIDGGNAVNLRECANVEDGVTGAAVTSRNVTGNFLIEAVLPDDDPEALFAKMKSGDQIGLSIVLGNQTGNTVTITLPQIQITDLANQERNDILYRRFNFKAIDTGNDDDITIKFS